MDGEKKTKVETLSKGPKAASQVMARLLVSRERSDGEERSEVPGGGGGQVLGHLRVGDVTYNHVIRWPRHTLII